MSNARPTKFFLYYCPDTCEHLQENGMRGYDTSLVRKSDGSWRIVNHTDICSDPQDIPYGSKVPATVNNLEQDVIELVNIEGNLSPEFEQWIKSRNVPTPEVEHSR